MGLRIKVLALLGDSDVGNVFVFVMRAGSGRGFLLEFGSLTFALACSDSVFDGFGSDSCLCLL
jgi:hypothetical protein